MHRVQTRKIQRRDRIFGVYRLPRGNTQLRVHAEQYVHNLRQPNDDERRRCRELLCVNRATIGTAVVADRMSRGYYLQQQQQQQQQRRRRRRFCVFRA